MNLLSEIYDLLKPEFTSLARRRDPQTSIDAGRKVQREGTVTRHERLIIECLKKMGPMTAKEMENHFLFSAKGRQDMLTSVEISRRSGGLIHTEPKRCKYGGTRNGFKVWELAK